MKNTNGEGQNRRPQDEGQVYRDSVEPSFGGFLHSEI